MHRFVESYAGRILPREPRVKLRLSRVDMPERSTSVLRLGNATLSQFVQVACSVRNELNEEVFQHPGELIVRHDPDTETRAVGVNHLQTLRGDSEDLAT